MVPCYMGIAILSAWYRSNTDKIYFLFFTLDWLASILRTKSSMNLLHSFIFNVKMVSQFFHFSATSLIAGKIDPAVIGSSRKICEMLLLLSPSILYHHVLSLLRLWKNSESAL